MAALDVARDKLQLRLCFFQGILLRTEPGLHSVSLAGLDWQKVKSTQELEHEYDLRLNVYLTLGSDGSKSIYSVELISDAVEHSTTGDTKATWSPQKQLAARTVDTGLTAFVT